MTQMKDRIFGLLSELGIQYRFVEHPAVFTVAEAQQHVRDKRPIKNLLLREEKGGRLFLVIMDGEQRLDTKSLAKKIGVKKLQFAKAEVLKTAFGVEPGAVSLFGILHPGSKEVEVVIEASLVNEPEVGFHPNDNTATIFIPGVAIEKIVLETGHTYQILPLSSNVVIT